MLFAEESKSPMSLCGCLCTAVCLIMLEGGSPLIHALKSPTFKSFKSFKIDIEISATSNKTEHCPL